MNYHRASLLFAGLVCAVVSTGCQGSTSSNAVPTDDIAAFIDVHDDGYGSLDVDVDLNVSSQSDSDGNYIKLVKGDQLGAVLGSQSATLTEVGAGQYRTSFSQYNDGDLVIRLDRSKYDDARQTVGILPEAVLIDGLEGEIISRDYDSVVLALPETGADKSVDIDGYCIDSLHYDVGTWEDEIYLDPGVLYSTDPDGECDVTVTITTTRQGSLDPALHPDSSFELRRSRSTTFYSIP